MSKEPRVLVVESNDALRVLLFTILRHQPLGVDTAATADEALERTAGCDYALIIVDMELEERAGHQFIAAFREHRPNANSFILAVRNPKDETYLDPQHFNAVMNKPLEIDTLAEVVRECAHVVPPPEEPLPCPSPPESEIRARMDRSPYVTN